MFSEIRNCCVPVIVSTCHMKLLLSAPSVDIIQSDHTSNYIGLVTRNFLEEIESVLQLKANLSVELEALQQIRSELEDSECMSEVHFRLERATDNNRRLHAALQAADEQITELVLSKRLLEAQMNELRNSRDAELAEAKERVRAAERAVVAATRSATSRNSVHPKSYTTLTGFSYDDFDSLEEETDDDDNNNNNNTEKPSCELTPTVDSKQNDPKPLEEKEKPDCKTIQPVITSSNNNVDNRPNHESVMESSTENFISCKDIEAITPASSSLGKLFIIIDLVRCHIY
ncbi:unnamed protein product [Trichobilharzia regenti]|nr:unnamed protein product [Trichobilharzia regenti]